MHYVEARNIYYHCYIQRIWGSGLHSSLGEQRFWLSISSISLPSLSKPAVLKFFFIRDPSMNINDILHKTTQINHHNNENTRSLGMRTDAITTTLPSATFLHMPISNN
jgi:hypothetical protein